MMKILWRLGTLGPSVVASTLLVSLVVAPALPPLAQVGLFYGGLLVLALLVYGVGEGLAVRVLFHARRPTVVEQSALAPIMIELCHRGLGPPVIEIFVARRPAAAPACAHGRHHVVLAPLFVHAVRSGRLSHDEGVAVIAHAALVTRAGLSRNSPAMAFWTLPWRTVCTIVRPWCGLLPDFVWKARFVVFAVAIWQSATMGPPVVGPISAAVLAIILATTYLSPICAHHWQRQVTQFADNGLVDLGLGPAMATFLRRYPQTGELEARLDKLEPTARPTSRLRLVQ